MNCCFLRPSITTLDGLCSRSWEWAGVSRCGRRKLRRGVPTPAPKTRPRHRSITPLGPSSGPSASRWRESHSPDQVETQRPVMLWRSAVALVRASKLPSLEPCSRMLRGPLQLIRSPRITADIVPGSRENITWRIRGADDQGTTEVLDRTKRHTSIDTSEIWSPKAVRDVRARSASELSMFFDNPRVCERSRIRNTGSAAIWQSYSYSPHLPDSEAARLICYAIMRHDTRASDVCAGPPAGTQSPKDRLGAWAWPLRCCIILSRGKGHLGLAVLVTFQLPAEPGRSHASVARMFMTITFRLRQRRNNWPDFRLWNQLTNHRTQYKQV